MSRGADQPGKKRSWRGAAPDGGRRAPGVKSWRKPTPDGLGFWKKFTRGAGWTGRSKWIAAATCTVICAVLLYWLWLLIRPVRAEFIAWTVADYHSEALPDIDFAAEDRQALIELGAAAVESWSDLAARLVDVPRRSTAVVYLALAAGQDPDGVYVLPAEATPDDKTQRLRLVARKRTPAATAANAVPDGDEVHPQPALDELLAACPAQRLLLLFDINRSLANWRFGTMHVEFAAELAQLVQSHPGLVVLCAAREGERSWCSTDLGPRGAGQSVFGHFVCEGLRGLADREGGRGGGNGNHRVSVLELYRYVHWQTNNWVRQNRHLPGQQPLLVPPAEEFTANGLNFDIVGDMSHMAAASSPPPSKSGENLDKEQAPPDRREADVLALAARLGESRDALRKGAAFDYDPLNWRRLTELLMHADALLRIDKPEAAEKLLADAQGLLAQFAAPAVFERERDAVFQKAGVASPADQYADLVGRFATETASAVLDSCRISRNLAESACVVHPAAYPWVARLIDTGDQAWREATDLVFLVRPERYGEEIATRLERARELFQQAHETAQVVAAAHSLRNRLLAELPDVAQWAAQALPEGSGAARLELLADLRAHGAGAGSGPDETWLRGQHPAAARADVRLLIVCELARHLGQLLDVPRPLKDLVEANAFQAELKAAATAARSEFDELEQQISEHATRVCQAGAEASQFATWRVIEDLLRFPYLAASLRKTLIENQRNISAVLQRDWDVGDDEGGRAQQAAPAGEPTTGAPTDDDAGIWQALWAMQVVSLGGAQPPTSVAARPAWEDWRVLADPTAPASCAAFGESIRLDFAALRAAAARSDMPPPIAAEPRRRTAPADNRAPSPTAPEAPSESEQANLIAAVRAARCLPTCDIAGLGRDAPAERRALLAAELWQALATRYLDDFWAGGDGGKDWYDSIVSQCLKQARELAATDGLAARQAQLTELLELRRKAAFELKVSGRKLAFGSERSLPLELSVELKDGGAPAGKAAVWLDAADPAGRRFLRAPTERIGWPANAQPQAAERLSLSVDLWRAVQLEGDCGAVAVRPRLLYRGHTDDLVKAANLLAIDPCPPPGIVVEYTPPAFLGKVIVQGSDEPELIFILDCSDSMKEPLRSGGGRKIDAAKQVLLGTLEDLNRKGRPVRISLMAYGYRLRFVGGGKPDERNPAWANTPNFPTHPNFDYDILVKSARLTPDLIADVRARLTELNHWGNTPLLGAVDKACQALQNQGAIVLISDGAYNDFGGWDAATMAPKPEAQQEIRRLHDRLASGIELHIVGFDLSEEEKQILRDLDRRLERAHFYAPDDSTTLDKVLGAAADFSYTIVPQQRNRQPIVWPLGPTPRELPRGKYLLKYPNRRDLEIEIGGGELLVFDLEPGRLRQRWCPVAPPFDRRSDAPRGSARTKLAIHRLPTAKPGEYLVSLQSDLSDAALCVPRSQDFFFEVAAADAPRRPLSLKWGVHAGQPGPVWSFELTGSVAEPAGGLIVRAFWTEPRRGPGAVPDFINTDALPWGHAARELRLDEPGGRRFTLGACTRNEAAGTVAVVVTAGQGPPLQPIDPVYGELFGLGVELIPPDAEGGAADAISPIRREFLPDDGQMTATFDVGKQRLNLTGWQVFFTTRAARVKTATGFELVVPLK